MMNPINFNIVNNQYINKQNSQNGVLKPSFADASNTELSNYEVGQAILNRNHISFRNLATPIEVTDKYNKKIEGKDHLDLPNIHVYEYPDTNLQVFVNADDKIKPHENNELEHPKYMMLIENNSYEKHNLLKEKLLCFLLGKNDTDIASTSFCLSISNLEDTDLSNYIKKINQEIFINKFDNEDLKNAKKELKVFLKSPEYIEQNKYAKKLYNNSDLKSDKELELEIEDVTVDDMQKYYEEYLKNSSVRVFLTTSKEYFKQNKDTILKQINPKTNLKFLNSDIANSKVPELVGNTLIVDKSTLKIPTKAANTKDSIIENIAINILNSDKDINKNYSIYTEHFSVPLELKNNSPIKYHCNFCTIDIKDGDKNFTDFANSLSKIRNKDLASEIEKQKYEIKEKLKQTFTGERLDFIKHLELMSYSDEVFNLYELIDSISEDDIKQYYKNLISAQKKGVN